MATAPGTPEESAQSPPPLGVQGDLELELLGLANSLYNLGTTVVNDSTKERQLGKTGPHGDSTTGKQVGARVNDVIVHLAAIEQLSEGLRTMIPMQVLQDVDSARNPMILTKDRIERAATENQFMNGKIQAIESYRQTLDGLLATHFPELAPYLPSAPQEGSSSQAPHPPVTGA